MDLLLEEFMIIYIFDAVIYDWIIYFWFFRINTFWIYPQIGTKKNVTWRAVLIKNYLI